jgi:transcriptional regulator with XRE-family HTH domain
VTEQLVSLGDRVRALREAKGWSQGQFLTEVRRYLPPDKVLVRQTLSRLENGHHRPGLETLRAVAAALEVPLTYLVSAEEQEPDLLPLLNRLNRLSAADRQRVVAVIDSLLDAFYPESAEDRPPAGDGAEDPES